MVKRGAALYTHLAIMCVYLYVYLCMMHILVFFYFLCSPLEKMISTTAIGGHGTLVKRETGSGLCSAHVTDPWSSTCFYKCPFKCVWRHYANVCFSDEATRLLTLRHCASLWCCFLFLLPWQESYHCSYFCTVTEG